MTNTTHAPDRGTTTAVVADVEPGSIEEHTVEMFALHEDSAVLAERRVDGRCSATLEECGRGDLLAEQYLASCSCGALSDQKCTWQQARWWAREHRTNVGLGWQRSIPETPMPA